jgi:predicted transcriptional regulator
MAKDLTSLRIESALLEALERISKQSEGLYFDRSVNWLIGRAVQEFVERNDPKGKKKAAGDK